MFTVKLNADEKHTYLQRERKKAFQRIFISKFTLTLQEVRKFDISNSEFNFAGEHCSINKLLCISLKRKRTS